jgi:amino acid adenylation domain-containing protein
VLPLSARSAEALREIANRLATRLRDDASHRLVDVCHTAAARRDHHDHRLAVVAATRDAMARQLDAFARAEADAADVVSGRARAQGPPKLAFVFAGMGPQWLGMGRQLLSEEPAFREALEACDRVVRPLAGWSVVEELTADPSASRLAEARVIQVVNCAFQIALATQWRSLGIVPDAIIGHSAGELAAAHVAGAVGLDDVLRIAYHRGQLLHRASGTGTMLAAALTPDEATALLDGVADRVSIAAINGPASVTLTGDTEAIERIAQTLEQQERFCRRLAVEVPYHGPQLDPMREELLAALSDLRPVPPSIPLVSGTSGDWAGDQPLDAEYWWANARRPVRFADGVDTLMDAGHELFLEISPHPVLRTSVAECCAHRGTAGTVLPTLRREEDERAVMLGSLAALYVRGRPVDWRGLYPRGAHVPLPTYPWQRERHWFEPRAAARPATPAGTASGHPLLGRRFASARPTWEVDLSDAGLAYLDDHKVQGATVFPGAGYVDLALAAAGALGDGAAAVLEAVEFRSLLTLAPGRGSTLQTLGQPHDGAIEIHAAPHDQPHDWTLHAAARFRTAAQPDAGARVDLAAVRVRCATPMPVEDHYAALAGLGLGYDGAFRSLRDIAVGDGEAIAWVAAPADDASSIEPYRVHPALLDSAFQVLAVAAWPEVSGGDRAPGPVLPVSIDRVAYALSPGPRFWAHAVARRAGDGVLEGDVRVLDEDGRVALSCEGLRLTLLDAATPRPGSDEPDWRYEFRWEQAATAAPAAGRDAALPAPSDVRDEVEARLDDPGDALAVARYVDVIGPTLDRIALGFAAAALEELGWSPGDRRERAPEALGIPARQQRLGRELMRLVAASAVPTRSDPADLQRQLDDLVAEHPECRAEAELVRRGGVDLAAILRGERDAREILLTDQALDLVADVYRQSPLCRPYHQRLGEVVAAAVRGRADDAALRVLEIGAGTGAATDAVLPHLPASASYVFTDVSPQFLARAQGRVERHPGLSFEVLDIEVDPVTQGFEPGSFDLVIAANVLHATRELRTSLRHARALMAPGGLLAVMEGTLGAPWLNLVFGLLDGWWRFTDLRSEGPLLQAGRWRSLLEQAGFESPASVFDRPGELQTVVAARAPARDERQASAVPDGHAAAAARSWLLLADDGGVAERVAAGLRARGDACTLAYRGSGSRRVADGHAVLPVADPAAIQALLAERTEAATPFHGVIHLWALDAPAVDATVTPNLSASQVMASQRLGCGTALALAQALERRGDPVPEIWLVTAGAQAVPGQQDDAVAGLAQSTLWGFGRALMQEKSLERCRLVDLGPSRSEAEVAGLLGELASRSGEEEVALRGSRRFVRRLRRAAPDAAADDQPGTAVAPDEVAFRLEVGVAGNLETLTLRETPGIEPGPGQVSIRVRASGVNFHDVLQVLGMLPSEARHVDPDVHALGMECAGVVTACGPGVAGVQPGDEVIAIGSMAHGNRVVTRAELTVPKPPQLSFEEGATIAAAFVTAEYALEEVARVRPGERVLVHAATGAVGLAAIQVCRRVGAEVFATAGTSDKRAYLRSLGVEHVMDSRSLAFADEVLERTGGEGVDVVLNSLAGEALRKGIEILRPYGRFVELGKRDIFENAKLGLLPFQSNLSFHAVDLIQTYLDRPSVAAAALRRVVAHIADGSMHVVPHTAFDLADAERAFRWMAQAKHIGKVVLTVGAPSYPVRPRRDAPLCRRDGTYLITGGLGGFGLAVAERLARRGAGTIVLMSRSGAPKDDGRALAALEATGATVRVVAADVAREEDVDRVLDGIRAELPPLAGIVHAAMVLDDDMLATIDGSRVEAVLAPKVAGAWNLHRRTLGEQLDFFVLFSSIAAVFAHPVQAGYAAANAFLDALASHRRALGLPAMAIGWGAVDEVGYVARHPEVQEYLTRSGFVGFAPDEALDAFETLLRQRPAHVLAARMEWSLWAEMQPLLARSPRFEPLAAAARGSGGDAGGAVTSPLASLRAGTADERGAIVEAYLTERAAKVLGAAASRIDPERALTSLGFDSLMAVELTTAIKVDVGVDVPVVTILQGASCRTLAQTLLEELRLDPAPPEPEAANGAPAVTSVEAEGHALSFEQRRFWYLDRLEPGTPAYNLPAAARLTGALDTEALARSIAEVVARHEMLRARVEQKGDEPTLAFAPPAPYQLPLVDLSHLSAADRESELQRQATLEIQRPFDLATGPLLRATLYRLRPQQHVILLVVHHLACDAWAMNWLAREIASLYQAFASGEDAPLPPPPARYADYVRRQRERLSDEVVREQLAYWTRQLAGAPVVRLPSIRARPSGSPRGAGGHEPFQLSRERSEALRALSRREGVTPFMTLLAAFATLLHRYTGETDLCVGTPVATRGDPGLEAVVGCFLNDVVLRTDLSGDPTFLQLLQRVQRVTLEAYAHRDVPFERVVEALRPERAPGMTPLFQAMLVLHNARLPELEIAGLELTPTHVEGGTAVSDIALVLDDDECIGGVLEYRTALLDREAAARMLRHFDTLLAAIVDDAERPVSALPLLPDWERRQQLEEWNDTAVPVTDNACAHELVEAQVERTPDAVAVVSEGDAVTYRDLDERANRLAHVLRRRGVADGDVVGVCLERSVDLAVAALGVLKAGGAYLPLDPADPPARRGVMIEDARARALVTQQRLLDTLAASIVAAGAAVVALDDAGSALSEAPEHAPGRRISAEQAAYVIYTSGSTGRPKGVVVPHRAIVNQVRWRQRQFPLSIGDAVLQRTPIGFDPSVWELLGPLSAGARLVVPRPGGDHEPAYLVELMAEHGVSAVQVVPSALEALLEQPGIERCRDLRHVFCGGEPLSRGLQRRFASRSSAALHNLYGPTETAIDATWWTCRPDDDRVVAPAGRPIANARVYLLDERLQPVPVGVAGELHIAGDGVALGYLNDEAATAARFVADPFEARPGARLYRTGDRARWSPDGTVTLLGRLDGQVKVRGVRVELGEVEAVLAEHPGVREAAVIADEGAQRLSAYLVPVSGSAPSSASLRRWLASRLPDVMVPSRLEALDALPRTASGKVDRRALAGRGGAAAGTTRRSVTAPRDDVERRLLEIWEELLEVRPISVTDDFFEVGGHSLLAVRLTARVEAALGEPLPVAEVLRARTVEALARRLGARSRTRSSLVPISSSGEGQPLFLVPAVTGSAAPYLELARFLDADRPVYSFEAPGLSDGQEPLTSVERIAEAFVAAMTAERPHGPYLLAGWSMGGIVAFEMARQLEARGHDVELLALIDVATGAFGGAVSDERLAALAGSVSADLGLDQRVLAGSLDELARLEPAARVDALLAHGRDGRQEVSPAEREGLRRQLAVVTANLRALRDYEPRRPVSVPITLLRTEDLAVGGSGAGWEPLTQAGVDVHDVLGAHDTVLRAPHVVSVARTLTSRIAEREGVRS